MASAIPSEPLLLLAQRIALGSLGVILLLVGQIIVVRLLRRTREARGSRSDDAWEPILLSALDGPVPDPLPPLLPRDLESFLHAWNHHRGLLAGEGGGGLDDLARRVGVGAWLPGMIRGARVRRRLLAIQTAGNLRDGGSRAALAAALEGRDAYLSFSAARSLLRIDAAAALPLVLPHAVRRGDWSPARVSHLLSEVPSALWAGPLLREIGAVGRDALPRAVDFLVEADPADALPLVRRLLAGGADPPLEAACLRVLGAGRDPDDRPLVESRLDHPDPLVRRRGGAAGPPGAAPGQGGEAALRRKLGDPDLEVRWEAANVLVALPGMDGARLRLLGESLEDRFARDMLVQVMAEREVL